jgi:NAD(P)-dependent dehydrogenase (short-subunit alcohol dehydrogenase family)
MPSPAHAPVVVVTGASAGIGRATVRLLAARGARIGLVARGRERLEATAREVERLGGRALVLPADVADAEAIEEAARATEERLGPLDAWINNAMLSVFAPIWQVTAEEFRRVTEVTYLGYVHGTQAALRRMMPRDRGVVVQVSSARAYRAIPVQSAYCAAKHAVLGFTDALRSELLHEKSRVKVTMVHLPATNTPQFDWVKNRLRGRPAPPDPLYQPEVAARGIAFALDHPRRDVYVGDTTVKALYAQRFFPGLFDRWLARNAWEGQMDPREADDPERPSNLWEPVPGDWDAHGRFDHRAVDHSAQLWVTTHRPAVATLAAGAAALAGLLAWRRRA